VECADLCSGDRLVSTLDHKLGQEVTPVRRLEVITGAGRRRRFTEDFKAGVVEEALAPGAVVSEVARRHGLTPQQVFTWRRQARKVAPLPTESEAPTFVPAVVETALQSQPRKRLRQRTHLVDRSCGRIEVEIEGVTVRIGYGADTKTIAAVLRALKASA
jgi:transposase